MMIQITKTQVNTELTLKVAGRLDTLSVPELEKVVTDSVAGVTSLIFDLEALEYTSSAGLPYDPLAKADPDVTLSAEERQVGGLGIFLVKKNMDTVAYRRENGKNILTMTKAI